MSLSFFFNQKENLILLKFKNQQEKKDSLKEVLASPHPPSQGRHEVGK